MNLAFLFQRHSRASDCHALGLVIATTILCLQPVEAEVHQGFKTDHCLSHLTMSHIVKVGNHL